MPLTKADMIRMEAAMMAFLYPTPSPDDPICRRPGCGLQVTRNLSGKWTHYGNDGGLSVGCRAASFTPGEGWNDDLPRKGNAMAPLRRR